MAGFLIAAVGVLWLSRIGVDSGMLFRNFEPYVVNPLAPAGPISIVTNLVGHIADGDNLRSVAQWTAAQFDPTLNWADIEWVRALWPGRIILKGILDPEDAKIAARMGVSALVVSNHGGRQLDGAPSAISALPAVADAVGSDIEIMFDSGIRSGQDVLRALALGARSCMIGRAYLYGLGAGGLQGVAKAIEIIRKELDTSMALTGITSVAAAGPQILLRGIPLGDVSVSMTINSPAAILWAMYLAVAE